MTAPLAHDFPLMSALSTRPPHVVAIGEMRAELAAEELHRLDAYPKRIAKGRMSRDQMQHHLELWRAIRLDLAQPCDGWFPGDAGEPLATASAARKPAFGWEDKVRELRAELAYRRNAFPLAIRQHGGDPALLADKMERLEAVHRLYWLRLAFHDLTPEQRALPPAGRRETVRRLAAAADHWVALAVARREPALAGDPWAETIARWYRDGGRELLLALCPDVPPEPLAAAA